MPPKAKAKGRAKAKAKVEAAPKAAAGQKRKAEEAAAGQPKAKKGRPVDSAVPGRESYSVVDDWSVMLNQTNVGANNNKYYKIQVLQIARQYWCWTHWGRVGATGQNQLQNCGPNLAAAQAAFKSKFKQKSSIDYGLKDSHDWTPKVGKYTLVKVDEEEGDGGGDAPLGKLSVEQIEKGQAVLKRIDAALGKSNAKILADLSSAFYTLIPHNFGFKVPPAINTKEMFEAEEELLKFYLRMGFDETEGDEKLSPVDGIMKLALPPSLDAAAGKLCSGKDIKSSVDKGKTHAGKQSGNPAKAMEAHLYAAIMLYTSNAIYRELNAVLRSEDRTKIKKFFQYLRLLLEALGRLPQQKRTLWRGISVDLFDQYKVGSTITWWGVSSCTSDINVAKNFMNGCGGKCTLLTVKSKTAADISEITFFGNEKENLVAPGTQMKVLKSKREGKVTHIELEEVGRVLK